MALARELARNPRDTRVKLFVTALLLKFRRDHPILFSSGDYHPLETSGPQANHLCAFAWRSEREQAVVIVPRLIASLGLDRIPGFDPPVLNPQTWGDTAVTLDSSLAGKWRNVLTGESLEMSESVPLSQVLGSFPVAVLERSPHGP